jgi:3D (Asp-Asp-Asp) domain-containing protein
MTAYTKSVDETDSDPNHTAIMREGVPGWTVAVSRDLLEAGLVFGTRIWAEGVGVGEVGDVMNSRYRDRIDVMVGTKKQARKFGVKENVLVVRIKGD